MNERPRFFVEFWRNDTMVYAVLVRLQRHGGCCHKGRSSGASQIQDVVLEDEHGPQPPIAPFADSDFDADHQAISLVLLATAAYHECLVLKMTETRRQRCIWCVQRSFFMYNLMLRNTLYSGKPGRTMHRRVDLGVDAAGWPSR